MSKGYVYILSNPAMPGLIKIGRSENDPQIRAQQLYSTGVPEPFIIEFVWFTQDCVALEQEIHSEFSEKRNRGREFFSIEPKEVIEYLLNQFLDKYELCVTTQEVESDHNYLCYVTSNFTASVDDMLGAISYLPDGAMNSAIEFHLKEKAHRTSVRAENIVWLESANGKN